MIHIWLDPQMQMQNCEYIGPLVKLYMDFSVSWGVSAPNLCVVQGSTALKEQLSMT